MINDLKQFSVEAFRDLLPEIIDTANGVVFWSGLFENGKNAYDVATAYANTNGYMTLEIVLEKMEMAPPAAKDIESWKAISKILAQLCKSDPYVVLGDTATRFNNVLNSTELAEMMLNDTVQNLKIIGANGNVTTVAKEFAPYFDKTCQLVTPVAGSDIPKYIDFVESHVKELGIDGRTLEKLKNLAETAKNLADVLDPNNNGPEDEIELGKKALEIGKNIYDAADVTGDGSLDDEAIVATGVAAGLKGFLLRTALPAIQRFGERTELIIKRPAFA